MCFSKVVICGKDGSFFPGALLKAGLAGDYMYVRQRLDIPETRQCGMVLSCTASHIYVQLTALLLNLPKKDMLQSSSSYEHQMPGAAAQRAKRSEMALAIRLFGCGDDDDD